MAMYADNQYKIRHGLILTDSLGKTIGNLFKAEVVAVPGLTLNDLIDHFDVLDYSQYKCIILLVGTNNISDIKVWKWYKNQVKQKKIASPLPVHKVTPIPNLLDLYQQLILKIRETKPDLSIIISAILPRLFDFKENSHYIFELNRQLESLCKVNRCKFIKTYKVLMKGLDLKENIFLPDGLHLTDIGTSLIRNYFREQIAISLKSLQD